jgi:hypothetical protein
MLMSGCISLMNLLGHEPIATTQRYATGAGNETRWVETHNPLYTLLEADF